MSSTVWLDAFGNTRITLVRTTSGIGPILADMANLCNAQPLECWEGPQSLYTPAPTSGQYGNALQAARLVFLCADGTEAVIVLYAPLLSIFLSDGVTVDETNAGVVQLISDCVGSLRSASGSLATGYLSGSAGPRPTAGG